jgi:hypothetical protein
MLHNLLQISAVNVANARPVFSCSSVVYSVWPSCMHLPVLLTAISGSGAALHGASEAWVLNFLPLGCLGPPCFTPYM